MSDSQPKRASLWWSSTFFEEIKEDMATETEEGTTVPMRRASRYWEKSSIRLVNRMNVWRKVYKRVTQHGGEMPRSSDAEMSPEEYIAGEWWSKPAACSSLLGGQQEIIMLEGTGG